ncbi:hypothetical protein BH23VER1_BH23VER1_21460 [soil metagenome]
MICLPANLPLLQVGSQEVHCYEARWLEQSIAQAARQAGHDKWIFAEDIAHGVLEYLRERFVGTRITLADLFDKIARTLDTVGFPDIAAKLEAAPPPIRVSLVDIAQQAAPGFDLLFYQLIDSRIQEIRISGASKIRFLDFQASVRLLEGSPRWQEAVPPRRAELLALLRHRASTGGFSFVLR